MLRAGPFSDQRVIGLLNRRFVPLFFDLSDRGFAADPAARKFVVAACKELGGNSVPTPSVLLMTPDGEVVGEVSNYASEDQVLQALRKALAAHPDYARPGPAESALTSDLDRALVHLDLGESDAARKCLQRAVAEAAIRERAHYYLGRLARIAADYPAMERHFAKVEDKGLLDDVRMERALRCWQARDFAGLAEALEDFPATSNRHTEARYHRGLALFHQGDTDGARKLWEEMAETCSQDPFVYRADWAHATAGRTKGQRVVMRSGGRGSPLGRIGYMGRDNPDLERDGRQDR